MVYSEYVKFVPWKGEEYQYGILGFDENGHIIYGTKDNPGKKVLVLGDSLYCANEEDATRDVIQVIIQDLLNPKSQFEPYKNTFTKFTKSLTGYYDELTFDQRFAAWHHLMFYNYVQTPMSATRVAPTIDDYRNSDTAFWEVLKESDADIVIAWGKRLYLNLPQGGAQVQDLEIKDGKFEGDAIEIWSYEVNGKMVQVLHINHPSAAYVLEYWGAFIHQFITERG